MGTALSRLRVVGDTEGTSYLLLLGVAMPLKYLLDFPMAVTVMGSIHGFLFVLFLLALAAVWRSDRWPLKRVLRAFALSLIPFGTYFLGREIRREENSRIIMR